MRPCKKSPNSPPQVGDASSVQMESCLFGFMQPCPPIEQPKGSLPRGRSAVRSGAATGLSMLAVSAAAALAGALSRAQVRSQRRDRRFPGRLRRLPRARARGAGVPAGDRPGSDACGGEGRLGGEFVSYASRFVAVAVPATVIALVFSDSWARLLTGRLPADRPRSPRERAVWLVPAAFAQMLAALAASALAAKDSYVAAALGVRARRRLRARRLRALATRTG